MVSLTMCFTGRVRRSRSSMRQTAFAADLIMPMDLIEQKKLHDGKKKFFGGCRDRGQLSKSLAGGFQVSKGGPRWRFDYPSFRQKYKVME